MQSTVLRSDHIIHLGFFSYELTYTLSRSWANLWMPIYVTDCEKLAANKLPQSSAVQLEANAIHTMQQRPRSQSVIGVVVGPASFDSIH